MTDRESIKHKIEALSIAIGLADKLAEAIEMDIEVVVPNTDVEEANIGIFKLRFRDFRNLMNFRSSERISDNMAVDWFLKTGKL